MCNVKLKWVDLNFCFDQLKGELGVKKIQKLRKFILLSSLFPDFLIIFLGPENIIQQLNTSFTLPFFIITSVVGNRLKTHN